MDDRKLTVYNEHGLSKNRRRRFFFRGVGWNRPDFPQGINYCEMPVWQLIITKDEAGTDSEG